MANVYTTKLKKYPKSGAMIYIPQDALEDPEFPFKDGDILRIKMENPQISIIKPAWFELINWSEPQMRQGFNDLPEEIQAQIREKGLAPE